MAQQWHEERTGWTAGFLDISVFNQHDRFLTIRHLNQPAAYASTVML